MTFATGIWSEETRHLTADYLAGYRIPYPVRHRYEYPNIPQGHP